MPSVFLAMAKLLHSRRLRRETHFFVDDESKILDGIRRSLYADRDRWDMQFVVGGAAALEACEASSFDIVISDMRMPGMDGATLLKHIRDRFPNTARIILSGFSDAALSTQAVAVAHRFGHATLRIFNQRLKTCAHSKSC